MYSILESRRRWTEQRDHNDACDDNYDSLDIDENSDNENYSEDRRLPYIFQMFRPTVKRSVSML